MNIDIDDVIMYGGRLYEVSGIITSDREVYFYNDFGEENCACFDDIEDFYKRAPLEG